MKNTYGHGRGFVGQRVALAMQCETEELESCRLDYSVPADWFVIGEPFDRLPASTGVIRSFYDKANKARFFVLTGPGFPILAEGELPPVYRVSLAAPRVGDDVEELIPAVAAQPAEPLYHVSLGRVGNAADTAQPSKPPAEPRPDHPKPFIIAVDFDQTLATGPFPAVGDPVPAAFEYLKIFQQRRARLILWTMRSDGRKQYTDPERRDPLTAAVEFCRAHGVEFWAVNGNPEQADWTGSPKAYAHVYIDDAAFGCPLLHPGLRPGGSARPVVDWLKVGPGVVKLLDEHNARHQ